MAWRRGFVLASGLVVGPVVGKSEPAIVLPPVIEEPDDGGRLASERTKRVLVVDDYPDTAEVACTLLGLFGHACWSASSGREALARVDELEIDVAIIDLGLPDLSGYEVARALRRDHHDLYLIALTGWSDARCKQETLAAGFDRHVLKPVDATTLRDAIRGADARHARGSIV